jgi:hypothetical protein
LDMIRKQCELPVEIAVAPFVYALARIPTSSELVPGANVNNDKP